MRKRTGFTLIELLVVIAIIALLLSIVMPALKMTKKQAQAVICRSNLKQWGMVFALYAQDNEDKLPQSISDNNLTPQAAYWMGATIKYYEDPKIRFCPSCKTDKDNDPYTYNSDDYGSTFENWGPIVEEDNPYSWWDEFPEGSYGINEWAACPPPDDDTYWGFPSNEAWRTVTAKGISNTPLFLDCMFVDGYPMETDYPPQFPDDQNGWANHAMKLYCMDRHNGGINSVFLDLSAKYVGVKQLWTLKWHRTYNTSGPFTTLGGIRPDDWPDWMHQFKDY